jgi:hypothetical protein
MRHHQFLKAFNYRGNVTWVESVPMGHAGYSATDAPERKTDVFWLRKIPL